MKTFDENDVVRVDELKSEQDAKSKRMSTSKVNLLG